MIKAGRQSKMTVAVIILLIVLFSVFGLPIYQRGEKKEFFVFTFLFMLGAVYLMSLVSDFELPNPTNLIIKTHQPALQLLEKLLPIFDK